MPSRAACPTGSRVPDALTRLVEVMDRLRSPGGCPWDAEQTHESLVRHAIEEVYELADAIEPGNPRRPARGARRRPAPGDLPRAHRAGTPDGPLRHRRRRGRARGQARRATPARVRRRRGGGRGRGPRELGAHQGRDQGARVRPRRDPLGAPRASAGAEGALAGGGAQGLEFRAEAGVGVGPLLWRSSPGRGPRASTRRGPCAMRCDRWRPAIREAEADRATAAS